MKSPLKRVFPRHLTGLVNPKEGSTKRKHNMTTKQTSHLTLRERWNGMSEAAKWKVVAYGSIAVNVIGFCFLLKIWLKLGGGL